MLSALLFIFVTATADADQERVVLSYEKQLNTKDFYAAMKPPPAQFYVFRYQSRFWGRDRYENSFSTKSRLAIVAWNGDIAVFHATGFVSESLSTRYPYRTRHPFKEAPPLPRNGRVDIFRSSDLPGLEWHHLIHARDNELLQTFYERPSSDSIKVGRPALWKDVCFSLVHNIKRILP